MKSDLNNEIKTKGRKLNLRFKDFAQKKKTMLENNMSWKVNSTFQSDEKSKKLHFSDIKYSNGQSKDWVKAINSSEYNTNNLAVFPTKKQEKVPNSLFTINQRRCNNN